MKLRKKISIILMFLLVFSVGCKNKTNKENQIDLNEKTEKIEEVERDIILEQVNNMSLNEKLGQLIIVGFEGKDINEESKNYIENLKVGGN